MSEDKTISLDKKDVKIKPVVEDDKTNIILVKKEVKPVEKEEEPQRDFGYNPKVKITNWNRYLEAEPKDNATNANFFLSSYIRLGTYPGLTPISTTHEMLRQIESKEPEFTTRRTAVNFVSYHNTEAPSLQKHQVKTGIAPLPYDYGKTNYQTTNQYEYRHPIMPVPTYTVKEKPTVNFGRRIFDEQRKAYCETKFFDDINTSTTVEKLNFS